MTETYLHIPERLKVGLDDTLGYVTFYKKDGSIAKQRSWESWRNHKQDSLEIDNKPISGFSIKRAIGGGGWSQRKAWCRVEDPRGFEFEISFENLIFLLNYCGYLIEGDKGIFQSEMVYGWDGTRLILCPVGSSDYKFSKQIDEGNQFLPGECEIGQWYTTKQNSGNLYMYCGKVNSINWVDQKKNFGEYYKPRVSETNLFRTYFITKYSSEPYINTTTLQNSAKTTFIKVDAPKIDTKYKDRCSVEETIKEYTKHYNKGVTPTATKALQCVSFADVPTVHNETDILTNIISAESNKYMKLIHGTYFLSDYHAVMDLGGGKYGLFYNISKEYKNPNNQSFDTWAWCKLGCKTPTKEQIPTLREEFKKHSRLEINGIIKVALSIEDGMIKKEKCNINIKIDMENITKIRILNGYWLAVNCKSKDGEQILMKPF